MNKSINEICISVSMWTTFAIALSTLFVGVIFIFHNMIQIHHAEEKRLGIIAPLFVNSISGNLALRDQQSILAIQNEYKKKYNLTEIIVDAKKINCSYNDLKAIKETCWSGEISEIKPNYYFRMSMSSKVFTAVFEPIVVWSLIPIIMLGMLIPLLIRIKLNNTILIPITMLANNPEEWQIPNENIAKEVIDVYHKLKKFISERDHQIHLNEKLEIEASIGKLVTQIAHDIRSPIAVLDMAIAYLNNIPEDDRVLIRSATNRIRDIANNLLLQHKKNVRDNNSTYTCELISDVLLSIISEKKLQYLKYALHISHDIHPSSFDCFVSLPSIEFKRTVSNLLDNAAESIITENGSINVSLCTEGSDVIIRIQDNGCGITNDTLDKILSGEKVSNKINGNGLGLSQAINLIKEIGNKDLIINSRPGYGTNIQINLPKSPVPKWATSSLVIVPDQLVVILDDDESIHTVWNKKLCEISPYVQIYHFYVASEFITWSTENLSRDILYLIDLELIGQNKSGLDVIEELNITDNTYLVTSHYEEKEIRERCINMGIKIIPKSITPYLSIISL